LAFLLAEHISKHSIENPKSGKKSKVKNTSAHSLNVFKGKTADKCEGKNFLKVLKNNLKLAVGKESGIKEPSLELIKKIYSLLSEISGKSKGKPNGITVGSAVKKLLALLKNSNLLNDKDKKIIIKNLLDKIKGGDFPSLIAFIKEETALLKKLADNMSSGSNSNSKNNSKNEIGEVNNTDPIKKLKVTDLRHGKAATFRGRNSTAHTKPAKTTNPAQVAQSDSFKMNKSKMGTSTNWSITSMQGTDSKDAGSRVNENVARSSDFETVLNRIRELLRPDAVKKSGIILRENGNGEIRLILKPESLGNVKIHLNITDNRIAGRIIVENNSMKQLIDSHLADLKTALMHDGFMGSSFDVSVSNGSAGKRNYQDLNSYRTFTDASEAAEEFNSSAVMLPQYGMEDLVVNLVV